MFKFLLFSGEFRCAPTFGEDFSNCTHSTRETDSDISKISSIYQSNFNKIFYQVLVNIHMGSVCFHAC